MLAGQGFSGAPFQQLQQEFRQMFTEVKICKPKSSRIGERRNILVGEEEAGAPSGERGHLPELGDA